MKPRCAIQQRACQEVGGGCGAQYWAPANAVTALTAIGHPGQRHMIAHSHGDGIRPDRVCASEAQMPVAAIRTNTSDALGGSRCNIVTSNGWFAPEREAAGISMRWDSLDMVGCGGLSSI